MRLHVVHFNGHNRPRFDRMVNVLAMSACDRSPDTPIVVHQHDESHADLYAMARPNCRPTWVENAHKARLQARVAEGIADGELACMIDADAMVLRDLSDSELLLMDCDFAYTTRPGADPYRVNTGVWFMRGSRAMREFARTWADETVRMLSDGPLHDYWRSRMRFGGIQQAALGLLLPLAERMFSVRPLECAEWNCVPTLTESATKGGRTPRVAHIMEQVRDWCFGNGHPPDSRPGVRRIVDEWRAFDSKCRELACQRT